MHTAPAPLEVDKRRVVQAQRDGRVPGARLGGGGSHRGGCGMSEGVGLLVGEGDFLAAGTGSVAGSVAPWRRR